MKKIKSISIFILAVLLFASFCQPVIAGKGKININTASKKELVKIKYDITGYKKKIAIKIVDVLGEEYFKTFEV